MLVQLPYNVEQDTNVLIEVSKVVTIYIGGRLNNGSDKLEILLPVQGWNKIQENLTVDGPNGSEHIRTFWTKEVIPGNIENITIGSDELTVAVFIQQGGVFYLKCNY